MKNAADHQEPNLSSSVTEKINETSDTNSESSMVSVETATIELDAESAAATLLNQVDNEGKGELRRSKLKKKDYVLVLHC